MMQLRGLCCLRVQPCGAASAACQLPSCSQSPSSPLLRGNEGEMWSRLPCSLFWSIPAIQDKKREEPEEGCVCAVLAQEQPAVFRYEDSKEVLSDYRPNPQPQTWLLLPVASACRISTLTKGVHVLLCKPRKLYCYY